MRCQPHSANNVAQDLGSPPPASRSADLAAKVLSFSEEGIKRLEFGVSLRTSGRRQMKYTTLQTRES